MDPAYREVLEIAGAYNFQIGFVPRSWIEGHSDVVVLERYEDGDVCESWWKSYQPEKGIKEYLDQILMSGNRSPFDFGLIENIWIDGRGNRVELWESDAGRVVHLNAYIDARGSFVQFSRMLVKIARRLDCHFFFWAGEEFAQPTVEAIYTALNRSSAAALARGNERIWSKH